MTSHIAPVLAGALLLLGGATAVAPCSQAAMPLISVADTASGDLAAKRDEYMQKAKDEFSEWQERMSSWAAGAKAKGSDIGDQARKNLDKAWVDVKTNWRRLENAAPGTWDKARATFEQASQRMKDAWENIHPEG